MTLREGVWEVSEIAVGGELVPPLIDREPLSLEVHEDRISGYSGVNRFMGPVEKGRPGLLATTMMAGPPELMAQEQAFLGFLAEYDDIESTPEGINLVREGVVVIALVPQREPGDRTQSSKG